jgi:hypothetical protein
MLDNIEVKLDDVKQICKKHSFDMDHFWLAINKRFNLNKSKNAGGRNKRSGVPVKVLFEVALGFPFFIENSVQSFFSSHFKKMIKCGRTSFYRFFQDSCFNWRKSVYDLNTQVETKCSSKNITDRKYPTALIIDDSTLGKRGKRIEGVTRVFDHVIRKHVIGYQLLSLCWVNGFYSRFLDFSLVGEKRISIKRSKPQFKKKRNKNSAVAKRKTELKKDKITLSCELISRAVKHGFIPDFLLTDTWFTCAKLINKVKSLAGGKIHFLGMIKNGRRKFIYNDLEFTLSELRKHVMNRKKRCGKYKSRYAVADCYLPDVGKVRVFFSRFHRNKKWVALITTKLEMSYIEAIEVYAIRWNIEIGFKEMKQLLGLGKSQANDFASQIAHTSCVFIAHALLADCKYHEEYQSFGVLFESVQEQYTALLTLDKVLILIEYILKTIGDHLGGIENITVEELLNSTEYSAFKEMLEKSLTFNVEFAKEVLSGYNQEDTKLLNKNAA